MNRLLGIVAALLLVVLALPALAELTRPVVPVLGGVLILLVIVRLALPPRRRRH